MIKIRDFSFTYKDETKPALQEIRLSVPEGGFLGVIGPAGAGKTTLARAITGMVPHHYKTFQYVAHLLTDTETLVLLTAIVLRQ